MEVWVINRIIVNSCLNRVRWYITILPWWMRVLNRVCCRRICCMISMRNMNSSNRYRKTNNRMYRGLNRLCLRVSWMRLRRWSVESRRRIKVLRSHSRSLFLLLMILLVWCRMILKCNRSFVIWIEESIVMIGISLNTKIKMKMNILLWVVEESFISNMVLQSLLLWMIGTNRNKFITNLKKLIFLKIIKDGRTFKSGTNWQKETFLENVKSF